MESPTSNETTRATGQRPPDEGLPNYITWRSPGWWLALILAAFSGLAAGLAFAPADLPALAWVALSPALLLILRAHRPRRAFAIGFVAGFAYYLYTCIYFRALGDMVWILSSAILALYWGLFAFLAWWYSPERGRWWGLLLLPFLYTGIERIKELGFLGYPLASLGYSQDGTLAPWAAIGGIYLCSALLIAANLLLASLVMARSSCQWGKATLASAGLLAILLFSAPLGDLGKPTPSRTDLLREFVRVAVVQSNPTMHEVAGVRMYGDPKESWEELRPMLEEALASEADVILLPETASPRLAKVETAPELLWTAEHARAAKKWVIWGISVRESDGIHNSLLVYSPEGKLAGRYSKHRLVSFGEYLPWRDQLEWLWKLYPVREFDYAAGPEPAPLDFAGTKGGMLVCFEAIFPEYALSLAHQGAQVLLVVTNDGWTPYTGLAEQNLQASLFRSYETGLPVARAALTGISAIVAPELGLLEKAPYGQRLALEASVPLGAAPTPYLKGGWLIAPVSAWLVVVCLLLAWGEALLQTPPEASR